MHLGPGLNRLAGDRVTPRPDSGDAALVALGLILFAWGAFSVVWWITVTL